MHRINDHKGLHLHRVHPILFGGSPTDKDNVRFIPRLQHAELVVFWNKKVKEANNKK
jgi:hypothetical protein